MRERLEAVSGNIPMVSLDVLTNQLKRNVDGQKTCIRCNRYVMMRYRQECNRCEATENLMYVYPVAGLRTNEGLLLCSKCRKDLSSETSGHTTTSNRATVLRKDKTPRRMPRMGRREK